MRVPTPRTVGRGVLPPVPVPNARGHTSSQAALPWNFTSVCPRPRWRRRISSAGALRVTRPRSGSKPGWKAASRARWRCSGPAASIRLPSRLPPLWPFRTQSCWPWATRTSGRATRMAWRRLVSAPLLVQPLPALVGPAALPVPPWAPRSKRSRVCSGSITRLRPCAGALCACVPRWCRCPMPLQPAARMRLRRVAAEHGLLCRMWGLRTSTRA